MYLNVLDGWIHSPKTGTVAKATEVQPPNRPWTEWLITGLTEDKQLLQKCLRCHGSSPNQAHRPPLQLWDEPQAN